MICNGIGGTALDPPASIRIAVNLILKGSVELITTFLLGALIDALIEKSSSIRFVNTGRFSYILTLAIMQSHLQGQ